MSDTTYITRFVVDRLEEAVTDSPVVLIHGPRQCGKTTLARRFGDDNGFGYFSFDSEAVRLAALDDPAGFLADLPEKVILDEIQRVPELFAAIKLNVDRDRRPGRFILTGSANVLLIPRLSDSLAGRMQIIRLHPLSRCEILGQPSMFLETLFSGASLVHETERLGSEIPDIVAAGGYPAALARTSGRRRSSWYRDYVETIAQRDIRELARIREIEALPQLVTLIAAQTAQLFNLSALSEPFRLSRPTIGDYVALLEQVFLIHRLQPWHSNRLSRMIKAPKIHLGDSGVACAVLGLTSESLQSDRKMLGHLLETFVVQELRRQASWSEEHLRFHHFRNKDGAEVDLVLEGVGQKVAGVEVKLSGTVKAKDFRGLRKLRDLLGERFKAGVVLYDGEQSVPFGGGLWAVPLGRLWGRG